MKMRAFALAGWVTAQAAGLFLPAAFALEPGQQVGNFVLLDHRGAAHELRDHSDAEAIVVMVQGNGCPVVRQVLPRFAEIRDRYEKAGVVFWLLNSFPQDDRASVVAEAKEYGIDLPVLMDEAQLVGEALGVERTAEVFVIDPADRWKLKYRGPVDDRVDYGRQLPEARNHHLTDALDAVVAGKPVARPRVEAVGCLVELPKPARRISYVNEIAPLLIDNCVECHRPGGIGPWAMQNYQQVAGFAPMIREVLLTHRMPPWHADPHIGEFSNDRSLSVEQKQKLVHWIEAGTPRDAGPDPLEAAMKRQWPEWKLGKPDAIVELPRIPIPATGLIPYLHPVVKNPVGKTVWLRAVDFLPEQRGALHHIITAFAEPPRPPSRTPRGGLVGGYTPGGGATVYPPGVGLRVEPNAQFLFQVHYTTIGRAVSDATRMGLYFHDQPPQYEHQGVVLENRKIRIPPRVKAHTDSARWTFDRDVIVHSLLPHAHYRGRSTEFKAIYPDGRAEMLLSVPKYDFNWQHLYELKTPKRLPKGTTVIHSTTYDNSAQNRANPDPDREVPWGLQSQDEMLFGVVNYRYAE